MKQDSLDLVLTEIERTTDKAKICKSVKLLLRGKQQNPTMKAGNNHTIKSSEERFESIKDHFEQHFFKNDIDELESDTSHEQLDKPITEERKSCWVRWDQRRTAQYGPDILVTRVTNILNGAFEQHPDLKIGHGILVPLQKPRKKKGIVKNLRQVILLPTICKLLSLITLNRFRSATDTTSPTLRVQTDRAEGQRT